MYTSRPSSRVYCWSTTHLLWVYCWSTGGLLTVYNVRHAQQEKLNRYLSSRTAPLKSGRDCDNSFVCYGDFCGIWICCGGTHVPYMYLYMLHYRVFYNILSHIHSDANKEETHQLMETRAGTRRFRVPSPADSIT